MTNLENYYGISVKIDKELDPYRITLLKEKANKIAELACFDITKFFVYIHHIQIAQVKVKHFSASIPVDQRIEKLHVSFTVNEKQRKKGAIMFFNDHADLNIDKNVEYENGKQFIKRLYPGSMLISDSIDTELITFIDKSIIKNKHRKIKVSIFPNPTDYYFKILEDAKKDKIYTNIDLPFEEKIKLNFQKVDKKRLLDNNKIFRKVRSPIEDTVALTINNLNNNTMEENKYVNKGNVGAMGDGSSASNFTQNLVATELDPGFDYESLSNDLAILKRHLQQIKDENNHENFDAISGVIKAEKASKDGDGNSVLKFLKGSGKWALDAATSIGTTLAAEVIKKSMGL